MIDIEEGSRGVEWPRGEKGPTGDAMCTEERPGEDAIDRWEEQEEMP